MYISCIYFLLKKWWWILPAKIAIPSTVDIQDAELLALEEELKALDAEAIGSTWTDEKRRDLGPQIDGQIFGKLEVGASIFLCFLWANFWDIYIWIEWQHVGLVRDFLLK